MAKRLTLTDRKVKALVGKVPSGGGRDMLLMDTVVRPLGIRASGSGYRYAYVGRFPGSKNPTRRDLGGIGAMSLAEARARARKWLELIGRGIDPKVDLERERQAELRKQKILFKAVGEDYLREVFNDPQRPKRTAGDAARIFAKELYPRLGDRPITDISRVEIVELVNAIKRRPAKRTAAICLQHLGSLYRWGAQQMVYGIEQSPTALIDPKALLGEREPRTRVLTDDELRAFWHATGQLKYPYEHALRLLLLTGCRQSEIGNASWHEISSDGMLLAIPPSRFKQGVEHVVPIASQARSIIDTLPRFSDGDFMFSFTAGAKPVNSWGLVKARLDGMMTEQLGAAPLQWVLHDLRRTCRTRLSSLAPFEVCEAVIGHAPRGMARVYNQDKYLEPMRQALETWAARLRSIVEPPPENVVQGKFGGRHG